MYLNSMLIVAIFYVLFTYLFQIMLFGEIVKLNVAVFKVPFDIISSQYMIR